MWWRVAVGALGLGVVGCRTILGLEEGAPFDCQPGDSQICEYEGDPAKLGIGQCKAGERTCMSNGAFGPCKGQVLADPEIACGDDPFDRDCNGRAPPPCACMPGLEEPCAYEGPTQGACHAGTKTCDADGVAWGACVGEVVPMCQACSGGVDTDCDGRAQCTGEPLTALSFGLETARGLDAGMDVIEDVATDIEGNIDVAGWARSAMQFGPEPLPMGDEKYVEDAVIAKLRSDGSVVWERRFGGNNFGQHARSIAVGPDGSVVVAGDFHYAIVLGTTTLKTPDTFNGNSAYDYFLVKLDPEGQVSFARAFGELQASEVGRPSVAVDSSGDIWLAGSLKAGLSLHNPPIAIDCAQPDTLTLCSSGNTDAFVAKLDGRTGNTICHSKFGSAGSESHFDVALDKDDKPVLAGFFTSDLQVGATLLTDNDGSHTGRAFLAKLTGKTSASDGYTCDVEWARGLVLGGRSTAASVSVDAVGNIAVGGWFAGDAGMLAGKPLQADSKGTVDYFVARLPPSGEEDEGGAWAVDLDGSEASIPSRDVDRYAPRVAFDCEGNVLWAGTTGQVPPPVSGEYGDIVVGKLAAADGSALWQKQYGGSYSDFLGGLAASPLGGAVMGGGFCASFTLGAHILQCPTTDVKSPDEPSGDMFLAVLAP